MDERGPGKIMVSDASFDLALRTINGLHQIERTGWVNRGVENPESVGQHVEALKLLAAKFCAERPEINQRKLELMLEVHDWPEYKVGDIVTVSYDETKRKAMEEDKRVKEVAALRKMCDDMGSTGDMIFKLWEEYEEGKTPEAVIAKQLDKLQAMYQAWEYEKAGKGRVAAKDFIDYSRNKITDPLLVNWLEKLEAEVNKKQS